MYVCVRILGILPHKIDVKGLPLGVHKIYVTATDVFGSTADTTIDYLGKDLVCAVHLISGHGVRGRICVVTEITELTLQSTQIFSRTDVPALEIQSTLATFLKELHYFYMFV